MNNSLLLNDFYQFSMASGYWQSGKQDQEAVFQLFFRRNPIHGDYIVAAGLQSAVELLSQFHFTQDDLDYLKSLKNPIFTNDFLSYLKTLRFTGDIDAVPEGSVVFANEPVLRIKAPLLLCQLLETPLINAINFASTVATIASRLKTIAGNDQLFEFGLRRAQGPNGGLIASRSAYLAGFDASSNVLAGKEYGIPVMGTMAHSWVMSFDDEYTAFKEYARLMPDQLVLLVDTYDTQKGIENAIKIGKKLKGIRIDSGELGMLSKMARSMLDQAGLRHVKIYVSGDLTQARMEELKMLQAPIDGWGVGTSLSTAYEQPTLDTIYKLGAIKKDHDWIYKLKCSDNKIKTSDPGILQVKRFVSDKKWVKDIIYNEVDGLSSDHNEQGYDLLQPIFQRGKLVSTLPSIAESRRYCMEQVNLFHASKKINYSVTKDPKLMALREKLMASYHD